MNNYQPYLSEKDINQIIEKLASQIDNYCKENNVEDLLVISILNGALFFTSDLLKQMEQDVELQTIRIKSYISNSNENTELVCTGLDDINIIGKTILILDDVYDTGHTIDWLKNQLGNRGAIKVLTCALIDKIPGHPEKESNLDFVGHIMTEKKFLVGYGMDDNEHWRTMKDIVVVT